jgi:hypothetical protein
MGFLDKAKAAAEQATAKAKEGAQELQTKRDLSSAYGELGKLTYDLHEKGEVTHAELSDVVARIRALRESADADGGGDAAEAEPVASAGPPAMPS